MIMVMMMTRLRGHHQDHHHQNLDLDLASILSRVAAQGKNEKRTLLAR